jgi:hypothetical protein
LDKENEVNKKEEQGKERNVKTRGERKEECKEKEEKTTIYRRRESIYIPVVCRCLCTVDVVPPVACELLLVEQRTVGAEKRGALMALPSIVADMVRLYIRNAFACDTLYPSTMLNLTDQVYLIHQNIHGRNCLSFSTVCLLNSIRVNYMLL